MNCRAFRDAEKLIPKIYASEVKIKLTESQKEKTKSLKIRFYVIVHFVDDCFKREREKDFILGCLRRLPLHSLQYRGFFCLLHILPFYNHTIEWMY